ncbi:MAG: hypothetical protein ACFFC9_16735 [Promethearchaeota archaeon]
MERLIKTPYLFPDNLVKKVDNLVQDFGLYLENYEDDILLGFDIYDRIREKLDPIIGIAKPEDAKDIVKIYEELYVGTYPYREMVFNKSVLKLIKDPNVEWIVFKNLKYEIVGCITFVLNFKNKIGYIRGLMLKKQYQGILDITKAMVGAMVKVGEKYKDKILIYYVENRTAHAKSQYAMKFCGITPIAFCPNKDFFLKKVESVVFQIIYFEKVLENLRSKETPLIIESVLGSYLFADSMFCLGEAKIITPIISLDSRKVNKCAKKLKKRIVNEKYGYKRIILQLKHTKSYFRIVYTKTVNNFEKIEYKVKNLEELFIFAQELKNLIKEYQVRYCEILVSPYEPAHQKIFKDIGLKPRGYIPCFRYNSQTGRFEDNIMFNWYKGYIDKDIKLVDDAHKLIKFIEL